MTAPVLHLVPGSPSWPRELDPIDAPPTELWVAGRVDDLARRPRVAIVGTRTPTPYGEAQARRFATALAESGVCVVSGLARGVDQAAHEAALDAGGTTVAVLGSGVDRPWPRGELTERVFREGVVLSELPPDMGPRRHHFPLRNRLISGLAQIVVVIEAAFASGSLITARWAADQGRDVFAIPGRVDHPMARGCHRLLREGASLLESPDELLQELGLTSPDRPTTPPAPREPRHPIMKALQGETLNLDELCDSLDRPPASVLGELVQLELAGEVIRAPGGLFRLAVRGG